jgi:hypothetical protein
MAEYAPSAKGESTPIPTPKMMSESRSNLVLNLSMTKTSSGSGLEESFGKPQTAGTADRKPQFLWLFLRRPRGGDVDFFATLREFPRRDPSGSSPIVKSLPKREDLTGDGGRRGRFECRSGFCYKAAVREG